MESQVFSFNLRRSGEIYVFYGIVSTNNKAYTIDFA